MQLELFHNGVQIAEQQFTEWARTKAFAANWANPLLQDAPKGVYELLINYGNGHTSRWTADTQFCPIQWTNQP